MNVSFISIVGIANFLAYKCFLPPNRHIRTAPRRWTSRVMPASRLLVALFAAYYVLIAWGLYNNDENHQFSQFCPYIKGLNPTWFTWSVKTVFLLSVLIFASAMRLICYRQLGNDFTFTLNAPKRLVTSGVYRFIRHPSYTCLILIVFAFDSLMLSANTTIGCWTSPRFSGLNTILSHCFTLGHAAAWAIHFDMRIRNEEVVLAREFDKDWERYKAETCKLIPFLY